MVSNDPKKDLVHVVGDFTNEGQDQAMFEGRVQASGKVRCAVSVSIIPFQGQKLGQKYTVVNIEDHVSVGALGDMRRNTLDFW